MPKNMSGTRYLLKIAAERGMTILGERLGSAQTDVADRNACGPVSEDDRNGAIALLNANGVRIMKIDGQFVIGIGAKLTARSFDRP